MHILFYLKICFPHFSFVFLFIIYLIAYNITVFNYCCSNFYFVEDIVRSLPFLVLYSGGDSRRARSRPPIMCGF